MVARMLVGKSISRCITTVVLFAAFSSWEVRAQNTWEPVGMPPCGDISGVVISGDTIIAQASGSWRSVDGGQTWERFSQREDGAMYKAFGRIWMMDTDTLYVHEASAGWLPVSTPFSFSRYFDVLVAGDTVLIAGALINAGSVWMSNDPAGLRWTKLDQGLPQGMVSCVGMRRTDSVTTLYCGVRNYGVYELDPGGNWRAFLNGVGFLYPLAFTHTGRRYLHIEYPGSARESSDGINWTPLPLPTDYLVNDVAVDGATVCLATASGLYVSADSGTNWTRRTMGMNNIVATAVTVAQGRIAVGSSPYGVFISDDGGQRWIASDFVDPVSFIEAFDHNGKLILGTYNNEGYFLRDVHGWVRLSVPSEGHSLLSASRQLHSHDGDLYYYHEASPSDLWRSDDDGSSWNRIDTLTLPWRASMCSGGAWLYVTTPNGVAATDNHGTIWHYRNAGMTITDAQVAASGRHVFLADQFSLRHSSDAGLTWLDDTIGIGVKNIHSVLATDSIVALRTLNGTGSVFFRRHTATAFQMMADGDRQPEDYIYDVFAHNSLLYARDWRSNMYLGETGPRGWVRWSEGLPGGVCRSLLGIAGQTVYALDSARMLRSRSVAVSSPTQVQESVSTLDFDIELWPQPLAVGSRLQLRLRRHSGAPLHVQLRDILGRPVLPMATTMGAGSGLVVLPTESLPSGLYFLQAHDDLHGISRKVLIY